MNGKNWKIALSTAAIAIVFVAQFVTVLVIGKNTIEYFVTEIVLVCACCTFTALAFSLNSRNWKLRFTFHTLFSLASAVAISLLTLLSSLPAWACCVIPLGAYFVLYYVLGVVQIPIRISWRHAGYRAPFLPFFPLIPLRVFNRKAYAKNAGHAPIVRFSAEETKGLLVQLLPEGRKFLLYELSATLTEEDFFALRTVARKYAFLTLGYSVGWQGEYPSRVVLLPNLEKYAAGRKAVDRFFERKQIRFVCLLDEYAERGFWGDVVRKILPVRRRECKLSVEEEFDEKEILLLNQVQFALDEQPRKITVSFCVTFSARHAADQYLETVKAGVRTKRAKSQLNGEEIAYAYEIFEATDKTVVALIKKEWEGARDAGALQLAWEVGSYAA